MKIYNYELAPKTYVPSYTVKTNIVLHGSLSRTKYTFTGDQRDETCLMKNWNIMADKCAGHYVVTRNGTIYRCIDEENWSQHLGPGKRFNELNRATIGIFITNEMYLERENGKYYAFGFNKPYNMYTGKVFARPFKGYDYWADYEPEQIEALTELLKDVCERNGIPLRMGKYSTSFAPELVDEAGIVSAANLNRDSYSMPLPGWVLESFESNGIVLVG